MKTVCVTFIFVLFGTFMSAQIIESTETGHTLQYELADENCDVSWKTFSFSFEDYEQFDFDFETNATTLCDEFSPYEVLHSHVHLAYSSWGGPTVEIAKAFCGGCAPFDEYVRTFNDEELCGPTYSYGANTVHKVQYDAYYGSGFQVTVNVSGKVGFKITVGDNTHYGYFNVNVMHSGMTDVSLEIGRAYINATPGEAIVIGDTPEAMQGDFNGDDVVNVTDFIQFNSAFGNPCNECAEDLDNDGDVDVEDFLIFNSAFGE